MSSRNLLYCFAGLALGFALGFVLANQIVPAQSAQRAAVSQDSANSAAAPDAPTAAGPIDPAASGGALPPGHPDIGGTASDGSPADPAGVAATSPEAQAAMESADREPNDFKLQVTAARTFGGLRSYDKAALYLNRALKIKPGDAGALLELANVKYDAGDFDEAARHYERALAADPKNADARTDLGNSYSRRTPPDHRRAVEEYRKALAIDPRHETALQNLALAAINLRDKRAASDTVDKLASVNPNNPTLPSLRNAADSLP